MRRIVTGLAAGAAALLAAAAWPALAAEAEPFKMISIPEVEQGITAKNLNLFDANSPETYAKGHVPGAKFIEYRKFTEAELPKDRDAKLVFYCANTH